MESIYGRYESALYIVQDKMEKALNEYQQQIYEKTQDKGYEHILVRIKSDESMREKCRRKGLPETAESALGKIRDAIGVRVVCAFIDDVYTIHDRLLALPHIRLVEEKDYIRHAKPNGYRSFHMIILVDEKIYAEIQLRTISMDTWAALVHHLKYKKEIGANTALISEELKRCADELASTDSSMQTLRDMIHELR